MKAITRSYYGTYSSIEIADLPVPDISENEVLIRVYYTTVNRTDCAHLTGIPKINRIITGINKPRQVILGTDFAGIIVKIGKGVTTYQPGDRVFGFNDNGFASMAEFLVCKQNSSFRRIPESIPFLDAAASIEGAHYAFNFINKVKLKPGQRAFVNGGTGAIGSALIQLLKKAEVLTVTTGLPEHHKKLKDLGADRIIDHKEHHFTEDYERFDYVFDSVGKSRFKHARKILKNKGIYISSELGPYSENLLLSITGKLSSGKKVKFPFPKNIGQSLQTISEMLVNNEFRPLIDRSFDMVDAPLAFKYVSKGLKIGNVILKIPQYDQPI